MCGTYTNISFICLCRNPSLFISKLCYINTIFPNDFHVIWSPLWNIWYTFDIRLNFEKKCFEDESSLQLFSFCFSAVRFNADKVASKSQLSLVSSWSSKTKWRRWRYFLEAGKPRLMVLPLLACYLFKRQFRRHHFGHLVCCSSCTPRGECLQ